MRAKDHRGIYSSNFKLDKLPFHEFKLSSACVGTKRGAKNVMGLTYDFDTSLN